MRRELARRQEEPASLAAFVYHPYIASLTAKAAVAAALASDTTRWGSRTSRWG